MPSFCSTSLKPILAFANNEGLSRICFKLFFNSSIFFSSSEWIIISKLSPGGGFSSFSGRQVTRTFASMKGGSLNLLCTNRPPQPINTANARYFTWRTERKRSHAGGGSGSSAGLGASPFNIGTHHVRQKSALRNLLCETPL